MVELTKAFIVADFVFRATLQRLRAVFPAAQWFFHPTQGGGAFPPTILKLLILMTQLHFLALFFQLLCLLIVFGKRCN
jgi:hypothetical protein